MITYHYVTISFCGGSFAGSTLELGAFEFVEGRLFSLCGRP